MNAAQIRAALRRAFPPPDYAVGVEVAHATGFKANRHLDMVIMDTWPSRGLELMGVEIKVSTGDLARELAVPAKAEEVARFCNSFWLATPKGLVKDPSKLPFSWGLLEVDERGDVARKIGAKRKDAEPITREFVAALMRGACRKANKDEADVAAEGVVARRLEQLNEEFDKRVQQATENNGIDARLHRELREKLGDNYRYLDNDDIIKAMNIVMKAGLHQDYGGIHNLAHALRRVCAQVDQALVDAGLEPVVAKRRKAV